MTKVMLLKESNLMTKAILLKAKSAKPDDKAESKTDDKS